MDMAEISPLRHRTIEDMKVRNLSPSDLHAGVFPPVRRARCRWFGAPTKSSSFLRRCRA